MVENTLTEGNIGQERKFAPMIVVIVGPPLHGKTTLGTKLARNSNLALLDVDEARAHIFPKRIVGQMMPPEQERFIMLLSYQYTHETARDLVQSGNPVLITGAYTREIYHEMLYDLAKKTKAPLKVIYLDSSEEEVQKRLERRVADETLSNVKTLDQYKSIKARYKMINHQDSLTLDSGLPLERLIELSFAHIG